MKNFLKKIKDTIILVLGWPRKPIMLLIYLYQKTFSPDHGPLKARHPYGFCRYYPSCSEYAYQVIKKRGILVGLPKTVWRVLRCNPWSKGGVDMPK